MINHFMMSNSTSKGSALHNVISFSITEKGNKLLAKLKHHIYFDFHLAPVLEYELLVLLQKLVERL